MGKVKDLYKERAKDLKQLKAGIDALDEFRTEFIRTSLPITAFINHETNTIIFGTIKDGKVNELQVSVDYTEEYLVLESSDPDLSLNIHVIRLTEAVEQILINLALINKAFASYKPKEIKQEIDDDEF
ncbi:MAG: hypothetical protein WCX69_01215 [Candidatus Paceibacterota bacterium]